MSGTTIDHPFTNPRFPRSNRYDPRWVADNQMGPNVLWLAEWLTEELELAPGMRVLDLGCGRAASSVFLAREHGCTVYAADLWIPAGDNWRRVVEAGVADQVTPIRAEAHALPFAEGFFDAIVSLDAYPYFGTDDLYLGYLQRFLRPGGRLGVVHVGLVTELEGGPPEHLCRPQANGKVFWERDCCTFHSAAWWRRHWEKMGLVEVERADVLEDGILHWAQHERAVQALGGWAFPSEEEALRTDAGRALAIVRLIARRPVAPDDTLGADPHVWEPAFATVCAELLAK